jgi:predicted amidohydrolase
MRVLLAAMEARKGEVEANLRGHLALLERASTEACDVAVFPEFSLTGSVDPARRPEHALAVDSAPVNALVEATHDSGVAAVFGIAERAAGAFHITQLYAHNGRLGGVYRKRHLGEGEEGYTAGRGGAVFEFGSVRFAIAICAEHGVDFPWTEAAAAGASVVLFCSAPGLYGRRGDEAAWRDGHGWWVECGLGDAVRHARRLGLWVAMSTQAGSTVDEDFPGLAALVTPEGEVAARTPDWRAGTLTVDIPLDVTVHPAREAARALVVDDSWRTLLVRWANEDAGTTWWGPPGGGLAPGEDHLAALQRELREELGRGELPIGPWIGRRAHTFWHDGWMTQRERWALCRTTPFDLDPARIASLRSEAIHDMRWWSARDMRASNLIAAPRSLPRLLDDIAAGNLPGPDTNLGL